MNNKKDIMMNRLSKIIKSDEYLTKDELINYVFNDMENLYISAIPFHIIESTNLNFIQSILMLLLS